VVANPRQGAPQVNEERSSSSKAPVNQSSLFPLSFPDDTLQQELHMDCHRKLLKPALLLSNE